MNTIRSVGYGWAFLVAAGAGSYYFAKRSINEEREARQTSDRERKFHERQAALREEERQMRLSANSTANAAKKDTFTEPMDPSYEAMRDPAPTRHAPTTDDERVNEKSKFEASEVFHAKKGNRLTGFR
ncbi:hypothetical protein P152DRAFT_472510 [Eremomyces bilateralis CBS 781.70]|uniref:Uncharacterized protein n=1 Tax=Eremomyces bilateralis CBS 781.70 TaxID=1392243 RepID=A0A6G1G6X4_9PEZI|nr:uncharacterized protein P152DRAFT_472510 [Eremomyces bilateralis CBS 781.70]KAF1813686.1 hypothetical protein P152DRAFT_472510 [Eremomyces bilateralis CBS 781.70]